MNHLLRYFVFSSIAIAVFITYYTSLNGLIQKQKPGSNIINIAGRQRMLSQKILAKSYSILLSQNSNKRIKYTQSDIPDLLIQWNLDLAYLITWFESRKEDNELLNSYFIDNRKKQQNVIQYFKQIENEQWEVIYNDEFIKVENELNDFLNIAEKIVAGLEKEFSQDMDFLNKFSTYLLIFGIVAVLGSFLLIIVPVLNNSKQLTKKLQFILNQRELELGELQHRAKNNFQELLGVISIQTNDKHVDSFRLKNRIASLALVYGLLNQKKDDFIDLKVYLEELIDNLIQGKLLIFNEMDTMNVKSELALDIGYCINELYTNFVKHASSINPESSLSISVKKTAPNQIQILYKDDGPGYNDESSIGRNDESSKGGFGLMLIDSIVRKYKGTFNKMSESGTNYFISFDNVEFNNG